MQKKKTGSIAIKANRMDITSILNGIPHGAAILDNDHRIVGMNRILEALSGHAAREVIGVDGNSVIRSNVAEDIRNSLQGGKEMIVLEGDIVNANRKKIPMRFTATRIADGGSPDGLIMLVVEDMSLFRDMDKGLHGVRRPEGIIGNSPKLQEVTELLSVYANTDAALLITGETGTGKDLLAEAVHNLSGRANYPFIKVNCGALPETLLESEMFGHVKGAFTGASSDKPGMFRLVDGGTLFLTEIGDLPLPLQVKLLTVLDDKEFYPLGSSKKVRVDVRIIAGTHRDLSHLLHEGRFREDLYYRLNVLRAHLPPLRERGDDVVLLANHFLKHISANMGKDIKSFSKEAIAFLKSYQYPGNIRELRNIVEHAVNMCQADTIQVEHLPEYITSAWDGGTAGNLDHSSPDKTGSRGTSWQEIERKRIIEVMLNTGGNRTEAARKLGWGRSTLWRKMKQHGLA